MDPSLLALRGGSALWLVRRRSRYKKNPELVHEAAGGQLNRAIRALQLETELRIDPDLRADRFVERWQNSRKRELGIAFESGRRLGHELAFAHGIDLGRGRGLAI